MGVRSQVLVCADRYCAKNPYKRDCNTVKAVDSSKIRTSIRHKPVCVVVCSNNSSSIHHTICQKSPFYVWGEDAYTIILYYQTKKTAANSRISLYFRTLLCSSILHTVILIHTRGQWHDLLGHSVREFSVIHHESSADTISACSGSLCGSLPTNSDHGSRHDKSDQRRREPCCQRQQPQCQHQHDDICHCCPRIGESGIRQSKRIYRIRKVNAFFRFLTRQTIRRRAVLANNTRQATRLLWPVWHSHRCFGHERSSHTEEPRIWLHHIFISRGCGEGPSSAISFT